MHTRHPDELPAPPLPTGNIQSINETETKLLDTKRHPFGLILLYIQTIVGLGFAIGLMFVLLPSVITQADDKKDEVIAVLSVIAFVGTVLGALFLLLASYIYRANRLIATNLSVTQVTQIGLFNRKVSEITMANVEDVTSHKQGIFPTIFNFGTVKVETAGEQNNFIFTYCPNPDNVAKAVLDAREQFMSRRNQQRSGGH